MQIALCATRDPESAWPLGPAERSGGNKRSDEGPTTAEAAEIFGSKRRRRRNGQDPGRSARRKPNPLSMECPAEDRGFRANGAAKGKYRNLFRCGPRRLCGEAAMLQRTSGQGTGRRPSGFRKEPKGPTGAERPRPEPLPGRAQALTGAGFGFGRSGARQRCRAPLLLGRDGDPASAQRASTTMSVFSELAMKQRSCAS